MHRNPPQRSRTCETAGSEILHHAPERLKVADCIQMYEYTHVLNTPLLWFLESLCNTGVKEVYRMTDWVKWSELQRSAAVGCQNSAGMPQTRKKNAPVGENQHLNENRLS